MVLRCRTPRANQLGARKPPWEVSPFPSPRLRPPNFCCINCILSTKVINECDQGQQEPGLFYSPDSGTKYSHLKSRRQKPSKTFQAGGPFFRALVQSASSAKQNMIRRKGRRTKWKRRSGLVESGRGEARGLRKGRTDGWLIPTEQMTLSSAPASPPLRASPFRNYFRGFNPSLFKTGLPLLEDGWRITRVTSVSPPSSCSGRFVQTHVEVIEHLVHRLHPVAHPLELHVQVDELGLVLPPLVAVGRRQRLQLSCKHFEAQLLFESPSTFK